MTFQNLKLKNIFLPLGLIIITLIIFHNGITNFFSYDDFYHFNISQANSIKDFLKFFDLRHDYNQWGYFRPLSTQIIYWIIINVFSKNYVIAHIFLWTLYYILLLVIYKFFTNFTKNKYILWSSIYLYALSASHFAHLYSLANQEVILGIFYILSLDFYIKNQITKSHRYPIVSTAFFILALMSKESAITLPGILTLLEWWFYKGKFKIKYLRKIIYRILPFFLILAAYLYLHVFKFGLVSGDSYIWNFKIKTLINSTFWYFAWAINIPTTIINYIGPGLHINSKMWTETSPFIIPILILVFIFTGILTYSYIKYFKNKTIKLIKSSLFISLWFIIPLSPVIFMQWHKYPTYLTISFIIPAFMFSKFIYNVKNKFVIIIAFSSFFISSYLTTKLNDRTNWLSMGGKSAHTIYQYLIKEIPKYSTPKSLFFEDTETEKQLPWIPSNQMKMILSDDDFFKLYFPKSIKKVYYQSDNLKNIQNKNLIRLKSRDFLQY